MMRRRNSASLRAFGQAVEHPGAFAIARQEPRLDHHLEMARNARLRLAEDLGEIGDGELPLAKKGEDAQTRLLARRAQHRQDRGEGQVPKGRFPIVTLQNDIRICLCHFFMGRKVIFGRDAGADEQLHHARAWRGRPRLHPAFSSAKTSFIPSISSSTRRPRGSDSRSSPTLRSRPHIVGVMLHGVGERAVEPGGRARCGR